MPPPRPPDSMTSLEIDHLFKKLHSQKGRLPTLPCENNISTALGLNVLSNMGLENRITHHSPAAGVGEIQLVQVKAIFAIKVAGSTAWLCHHLKRVRRSRSNIHFFRVEGLKTWKFDPSRHARIHYSSPRWISFALPIGCDKTPSDRLSRSFSKSTRYFQ